MVDVNLHPKLAKRWNKLLKKAERFESYDLYQAFAEFLEDQEDYLLAVRRSQEYEKSGKKGISLEELRKKLKLDQHDESTPKNS